MTTKKILTSAATLLVVGLSCAFAPRGFAQPQAAGPAAQAPQRSVTAQAAYDCQADGAGPVSNDTASAQVQLAVPTSVAPGATVSLRGTLKVQFSEKWRQKAQALGIDTIDAYSSTMSTYRTMSSQSTHYFADRWQTGPTPVRNPMEVEGPLTFPSFTVPDNASGELKLQMMQNGATTNIVTNNPAKVAFTLYGRVSGPGGTFNARLACWLSRANPAVIATIPVSAEGPSGDQGATTVPDAESPTTDAGPGPAPTIPGAPDAGPAGPGATDGPVPPGGDPGAVPVDPGAVPPGTEEASISDGTVPGTQAYAPSSAAGGGVYVSTGVLVLGGFAIILATLGYAALTNFRIRSIRRSMDG